VSFYRNLSKHISKSIFTVSSRVKRGSWI